MTNDKSIKYIILFICVWIATYSTRNLLAPLLSEIGSLWSLDSAGLGWLSGSLFLSYMIFQLPSGILADKFGRKKMLILGLSIQSLGVLLSAFAKNETLFVASRLLSGIGQSALFITLFSLVATLIPPEKQVISTAIIHAAIPVGSLVGMVLSTELVLARGAAWSVPFFFTAMFSILVSVAAFVILRWEQNEKPRQVMADKSDVEEENPKGRSRQLAALSAIAFLEGYGMNMVVSWLPVYLGSKGFPAAVSGRLAAIAMVSAIPATFLIGQLSKSWGRIKAILLALMIITFLVYVGIVSFNNQTVLVLLLLLFGAMSKISTAPMHIVLLNRALGNKWRSTGLGIFNTFSSLSMFSAPMITGALLQRFQGFDVPWMLVLGFQLLSTLIMFFFVKDDLTTIRKVDLG